jgi:hypothetical protein
MKIMDSDEKNTTGPKGILQRGWFRAVLAAVILLAMLLIAAPHLMAWLAKDWLREQGAERVELQNIDFNPFAGVLVIEGLSLRVSDRDTLDIPRLLLELDWAPLFTRRVKVNALTVDGMRLVITVSPEGELEIGGISLAGGETAQEAPQEPWGVGITELNISNTTIDYHAPDLQLEAGIHQLVLRDLSTWANSPASLILDGALNGATFSLDGELPALADGYGYTGAVKLAGLETGAFSGLVQSQINELSGRLTLDSGLKVSYAEGKPLQLEQSGIVRLDGLQLVQQDYRLGYDRLQWDGETTLTGAGGLGVETSGGLTGSGLDFAMPARRFRLQQGELNWQGRVAYTGGEATGLQVSGGLSLDKAEVDAVDGETRLVGFDTFSIGSINMQGLETISIDDLVITNATLADTAPVDEAASPAAAQAKPLEIASLSFDHIEITDGRRIAIDTIESREARYTAVRGKDGKWRIVTILESLPFMGNVEQEPADDVAEPGSVRIGELRNIDMVVRVEDRTVRPPFRIQLDGMETTTNIDTDRPDQDTHVHLKGRTSRHDSIEIKGTLRPLASPVSLNLEGHIEGLEMPLLSPYAVASIGHRLDSGQLDAESRIRVDQGRLDGTNTLVMKGLRVSPVKGEELEQMQSQLAVPLDKGLDMLRDGNDVIRLKLPIKGDLENPDFDVSDVINQAVAKATREGAIASLTLLLQPYGSLITVARYAADKASAVRLDPVAFAPASSDIDKARYEYLDKVAGIIEKRPGINIKLCGVATAADREALASQSGKGGQQQDKPATAAVAVSDERLIDLANSRDDAVKDYLVSRHGIKPGRLVACQPVIDPAEGAGPRVDLLL